MVDNTKPYNCSLCGSVLIGRYALNMHFEKVHFKTGEYHMPAPTVHLEEKDGDREEMDWIEGIGSDGKMTGSEWNIRLCKIEPRIPCILDPDAWRRKGLSFYDSRIDLDTFVELSKGSNTVALRSEDMFKTGKDWSISLGMAGMNWKNGWKSSEEFETERITCHDFRVKAARTDAE